MAVESDSLLDNLCVVLEPILRDSKQMGSWLTQTRTQEQVIKREIELSYVDQYLDISFPQYTHSCTYPGKCQFHEICWGVAGSDPIGSGLYEWRVPNHPKENESC